MNPLRQVPPSTLLKNTQDWLLPVRKLLFLCYAACQGVPTPREMCYWAAIAHDLCLLSLINSTVPSGDDQPYRCRCVDPKWRQWRDPGKHRKGCVCVCVWDSLTSTPTSNPLSVCLKRGIRQINLEGIDTKEMSVHYLWPAKYECWRNVLVKIIVAILLVATNDFTYIHYFHLPRWNKIPRCP